MDPGAIEQMERVGFERLFEVSRRLLPWIGGAVIGAGIALLLI
jgi:hypothetical protein